MKKFGAFSADVGGVGEEAIEAAEALFGARSGGTDSVVDDNNVAFNQSMIGLLQLNACGQLVAQRGIEEATHLRAGKVVAVFVGFVVVGPVVKHTEDLAGEGGGVVENLLKFDGGALRVAKNLRDACGKGHDKDAMVPGVGVAEAGFGVGLDKNGSVAVPFVYFREGLGNDFDDAVLGVGEPASAGDVALFEGGWCGVVCVNPRRFFVATLAGKAEVVGGVAKELVDHRLDQGALARPADPADEDDR